MAKKEKDESSTKDEISLQESADASVDLISPEGCLILFVAIILDLIGLFFFFLSFAGIGIPLSFILDIAGMLIIGGWLFIRTGRLKGKKKNAEFVKKIAKKTGKRFSIAFFVELVPFLGDISPSWTILVFLELMSKK